MTNRMQTKPLTAVALIASPIHPLRLLQDRGKNLDGHVEGYCRHLIAMLEYGDQDVNAVIVIEDNTHASDCLRCVVESLRDRRVAMLICSYREPGSSVYAAWTDPHIVVRTCVDRSCYHDIHHFLQGIARGVPPHEIRFDLSQL